MKISLNNMNMKKQNSQENLELTPKNRSSETIRKDERLYFYKQKTSQSGKLLEVFKEKDSDRCVCLVSKINFDNLKKECEFLNDLNKAGIKTIEAYWDDANKCMIMEFIENANILSAQKINTSQISDGLLGKCFSFLNDSGHIYQTVSDLENLVNSGKKICDLQLILDKSNGDVKIFDPEVENTSSLTSIQDIPIVKILHIVSKIILETIRLPDNLTDKNSFDSLVFEHKSEEDANKRKKLLDRIIIGLNKKKELTLLKNKINKTLDSEEV